MQVQPHKTWWNHTYSSKNTGGKNNWKELVQKDQKERIDLNELHKITFPSLF